MKRRPQKKVDSIEKLARMVTEEFSEMRGEMHERFDSVNMRFTKIEGELTEIRRTLERLDTRVAAIELVMFGASTSRGGRYTNDSLLSRIDRLEKMVFKK